MTACSSSPRSSNRHAPQLVGNDGVVVQERAHDGVQEVFEEAGEVRSHGERVASGTGAANEMRFAAAEALAQAAKALVP